MTYVLSEPELPSQPAPPNSRGAVAQRYNNREKDDALAETSGELLIREQMRATRYCRRHAAGA